VSSILSLVNTILMLWLTFEVIFETILGGWVAGKELTIKLAQSSQPGAGTELGNINICQPLQ
jgi:hypothetical protein